MKEVCRKLRFQVLEHRCLLASDFCDAFETLNVSLVDNADQTVVVGTSSSLNAEGEDIEEPYTTFVVARVVDIDNVKVEDATVILKKASGAIAGVGITGSRGTYTFRDVLEGTYIIEAKKDELGIGFSETKGISEGGGSWTPSIKLLPPTPEVELEINGPGLADNISFFNDVNNRQESVLSIKNVTDQLGRVTLEFQGRARARLVDANNALVSTLEIPANSTRTLRIVPTATSQDANDVVIVARFANEFLGRVEMTNVAVNLPKNIRALNTPQDMPDRIPPRKPYEVEVEIQPPLNDGQRVEIRVVENVVGQSGNIRINNAVSANLSQTTSLELLASEGSGQTDAGEDNYLTLQAFIRGESSISTESFRVAAIPTNFRVEFKEQLQAPFGTFQKYGVKVSVLWDSDSGDPSKGIRNLQDLDQVKIFEKVVTTVANGEFNGDPDSISLISNQRGDATRGFVIDEHSLSQTDESRLSTSGELLSIQIFGFDDARTGTQGIPSPGGGVNIRRTRSTGLVGEVLVTNVIGANASVAGVSTSAATGQVRCVQSVEDFEYQSEGSISCGISDLSSPFTNPGISLDVNNDSKVTPLDALVILNEVARNGVYKLPDSRTIGQPYFDPNGDGLISQLDALSILNELIRL